MSRHYIEIENWPQNYQVIVGWDPGLATYFAQVDDTNTKNSLVWIGTIDIITTVDDLELKLNRNMPEGTPYGNIPTDIKNQLEKDKLQE